MEKFKFLIIVLTLFSYCCDSAETKATENTVFKNPVPKVEVLLIGTSHWNNYKQKGSDVAQSEEIDILSETYQMQLKEITQKIRDFNPSKVFVERTVAYQPKLDSLYNLYRTSSWGEQERNEIYQLGFRVANALNHSKVYGIDFRDTSFNYSEAMEAMKAAGQEDLILKSQEDIQQFETTYNQIVEDNTPLRDILLHFNGEQERHLNLGWYYNIMNRGGELDDFSGSFLASEWIRRNLHTYALIQKYVTENDHRIMILMGAGHTAVLHELIGYNPEWQIIPLSKIL
jgi:hypothetical protein